MKSNKKIQEKKIEEKNKKDCLIFMNYIKQGLINNGAENVNIETSLNHCLFTDCRGNFEINGDAFEFHFVISEGKFRDFVLKKNDVNVKEEPIIESLNFDYLVELLIPQGVNPLNNAFFSLNSNKKIFSKRK